MTKTMDKEVQRKYSTAISKGAGMIEETRRLLEQWRPDEPLDDFTRRVQTEGLLGNSTACRTRDVVRRVFALRFLRPSDKPAGILQQVLASGLPRRVFTELLFVFAARQDHLVYDFTIREYWPAVRRGRPVMDRTRWSLFCRKHITTAVWTISGRRRCRCASPAAFSVSCGMSDSSAKSSEAAGRSSITACRMKGPRSWPRNSMKRA